MFDNVSSTEDLIAAFKKIKAWKNGTGGKVRQAPRGDRPARQTSGVRPQGQNKCPNCGEDHDKSECKKPMIPMSERKCWTCGEKHMARDCPKKPRPIKAIEDGPVLAAITSSLNGFFAVDHEGYRAVRPNRRRTCQPSGGVSGAMVVPTEDGSAAETPKWRPRDTLHGGHTAKEGSRNLKTITRPMPTQATLGSFITKNSFEALRDTTRHDTTRHDYDGTQ